MTNWLHTEALSKTGQGVLVFEVFLTFFEKGKPKVDLRKVVAE